MNPYALPLAFGCIGVGFWIATTIVWVSTGRLPGLGVYVALVFSVIGLAALP